MRQVSALEAQLNHEALTEGLSEPPVSDKKSVIPENELSKQNKQSGKENPQEQRPTGFGYCKVRGITSLTITKEIKIDFSKIPDGAHSC